MKNFRCKFMKAESGTNKNFDAKIREIPHFCFLNIVVHFGQYQRPLGFDWSPMQPKWNHSIGQSWLSHLLIFSCITMRYQAIKTIPTRSSPHRRLADTGSRLAHWDQQAYPQLAPEQLVPLEKLQHPSPLLLFQKTKIP